MKISKTIWLIVVSAAMFAGCYDYDAYEVVSDDPVSVELAYAFSSPTSNNTTRQANEVVTSETTNPRHPESLRIIPLVNNAPGKGILRWEETVSKNNPRSRFYYYRYCDLPINTNGFLIYGNVEDLTPTTAIHPKMYNGSLIETFPQTITTVNDVQEDISFNLDPIYKSTDYTATNGIPAGAQALADCLTAIATKENFHTSTDATIKGFFDKFTNEGKHIPGSAASVRKWIEIFISSIPNNSSGLLGVVKAEAEAQLSAIASLTYPRDINLPDGAAVLRWIDVDENKAHVNRFEPQINTTTIDNINSIARFAYPAPLYYFIASSIMTSEEKVDFETIYSDAGTTAWSQVLQNEKFNRTTVSANTRAVALTNPVQYAVAQLKVKIKASASTLKDAENNDVTVIEGSTNFPLKGIIVCDQRPVNYRFEPKEVEQGTVSDAEVLFIYDNQVKEGCYLRTQTEGTWAEGCNTLVLQSLKNEDVNIILEFENNSGQSFTCIDGIVYPGTRFYMIGRVEASVFVHNEYAISKNNEQVFTKDFITTVNMTVSSLARAYNVPPNLLSPNLEIGVETTPQWEGATPTVIRLDN